MGVGAATFAEMMSREPRDVALLGLGISPPQQSLVRILHRGAPGKSIYAIGTSPTGLSLAQVQKGAAMPPDMVLNLILILAGFDRLRIGWTQPGLGTGLLLHYEFSLDGGATWVSTMSTLTEYTITGLVAGTTYSIMVRAVTNVGRGPGSAALSVDTLATTIPSESRRLSARSAGPTSVALEWQAPTSDGGAGITDYETVVIEEDGTVEEWQSNGSATLRHTVRGLRTGVRYGFRVRARNIRGVGPESEIAYAIPLAPVIVTALQGQQVPLFDLDRQSLIVRLGAMDCRIRVWWQPSDGSWFGSLEVPVNSPAVVSRRLTVDSGLLPAGSGKLPGNVYLTRGRRRISPAGTGAGQLATADSWAFLDAGLVQHLIRPVATLLIML